MKKITVYKVHCDGVWCAFDVLAAAVECLAAEIEAEADSMIPGQETRDYSIEVCEMTEQEYKALPEFNGF
ncbi:MAG: hypothetical protein ABFC57_12800 [Veillonellales bacterium]